MIYVLFSSINPFPKKQFLLSHSVFYSHEELSATFVKIKKSYLQTLSVSKSLKFVILERVNCFSQKASVSCKSIAMVIQYSPPALINGVKSP